MSRSLVLAAGGVLWRGDPLSPDVALVHRPRIFLADEPTGNLDPDTSWGIVQLLLQINHRGTTMLMATHNREVVDLVRRRVIAIDGGRVVRDEAEGQYMREGTATL